MGECHETPKVESAALLGLSVIYAKVFKACYRGNTVAHNELLSTMLANAKDMNAT